MNTSQDGILLSFQPIQGMRDASPLELRVKNEVINSVSKLLAENGFEMAGCREAMISVFTPE